MIAGPLAGSLLAELGARVIRVETLDGDHIRHLNYGGIGANRTMAGTQGLCLNLKSSLGQDILQSFPEYFLGVFLQWQNFVHPLAPPRSSPDGLSKMGFETHPVEFHRQNSILKLLD